MKLNEYFDHTNLNAFATKKDIERLCKEAATYKFASVCVNPYYVPMAKLWLKGTDVKVCTVIGFPLGQMTPAAKVYETTDALINGADEIDMVINVAAAKDGDWDFVEEEIRAVKKACGKHILKVILENCYLSETQISIATGVASRAGADFVKTSTGFGKYGARAYDVLVMRSAKDARVQIKAAGGIHTLDDVHAMIKAGATRIGCSHSVEIMEEYLKHK